MASVKELFDSRIGSNIGSAGVNLSRLFLVLTDNPTDDPARELQRNRLGVPYQAANPWNLDAKAIGYTVQKRIGKMAWYVLVTYELPNVIIEERGNIFPGWEVQIRGGGEQERLLQELQNPDNPNEVPRIYGPPRYEEVGDEDTGTHHVLKVGGGVSVVLPLWQTDQRIPVGWTRALPSMELTITKEVGDLTLASILAAHSFLKTVNDASFFGGGVGHVLLNAIQLSSRPGESEASKGVSGSGRLRRVGAVPIGRQRTLIWKVSLVFGYSVKRWDRKTEPHIWEDAKGAQSLVYLDGIGTPVEEEFRTGLESNFDELLRIFA